MHTSVKPPFLFQIHSTICPSQYTGLDLSAHSLKMYNTHYLPPSALCPKNSISMHSALLILSFYIVSRLPSLFTLFLYIHLSAHSSYTSTSLHSVAILSDFHLSASRSYTSIFLYTLPKLVSSLHTTTPSGSLHTVHYLILYGALPSNMQTCI